MNVVHGYPLIWICKMCSMGHPNRQQIDKHIRIVHGDQLKAQIGLMGTPYGYAVQRLQILCDKQLAVCAHRKLHYQPPPGPIPEWLRNSNLVVGECAHRTFNAYMETVLACAACGTLVPGSKFILENEEVRIVGQLHLTLVNEAAALRPSTHPSVSYTAPRISLATAGNPRHQQPVMVLGQSPAQDLRSQGSNFSSTQQQASRPAMGALLQALQQPVGAMAHIVSGGTAIRPVSLRQVSGATVSRTTATNQRLPIAPSMQLQPTAPRIVRSAGSSNPALTCQICNVECSSVASFKVNFCTQTSSRFGYITENGGKFLPVTADLLDVYNFILLSFEILTMICIIGSQTAPLQ